MSVWHRPVTLEQLNAINANTLSSHLGIVFSAIGPDFLQATMPVEARTLQPYGLLHGGASVALAETAGSTGANLCVDSARYVCSGQEINANHVRAVRAGKVTATARPLHLGRRSQVWSIEIVNDAGLLSCISRLTMAVLERKV
jgi:1,4-dihydroxy-2-naphthoyl-CoA hydrolase